MAESKGPGLINSSLRIVPIANSGNESIPIHPDPFPLTHTMADSPTPKTTASEVRIRDPLSEVTRKERKALLAVSLLGLVIANTGLLPTEIDALGVKFSASDQKGILYVLVLVTAYFAIAFALYVASDFIAWRLALRSAACQTAITEAQMIEEDREFDRELAERVRAAMPLGVPWSRLSVPISIARVLFEFVLPLGFAFYAIVAPSRHSVSVTTKPTSAHVFIIRPWPRRG